MATVGASRGHPCDLGNLDWEDREVAEASSYSPGGISHQIPSALLTNP